MVVGAGADGYRRWVGQGDRPSAVRAHLLPSGTCTGHHPPAIVILRLCVLSA